jgi:hypothetical protein
VWDNSPRKIFEILKIKNKRVWLRDCLNQTRKLIRESKKHPGYFFLSLYHRQRQ